MKEFNCKLLFIFLLSLAIESSAQSTSQNFPTPVTTSEISGTIKARDVGDPRLTTYFYTFNTNQGDVFINVVTKNLNGDIDFFIAEGLKPLTKIVVYADVADSETGRVLYFRKPEKIILRVEGRSPNDDAAIFHIKFAGSFEAARGQAEEEPKLPEINARPEAGIRVNSVGTIVEILPKPTPTVEKVPVDVTKAQESVAEKEEEAAAPEKAEVEKTEPEKKVEVVVTENLPPATEIKPAVKSKAVPPRRRRAAAKKPVPKKTDPPADTAATEPPAAKPKSPDPLENIRLIVVFKDGKIIERRLSDVLRFNVVGGVLTIIAKDGSIGRYPILDIAKVTIE